MAEMIFVQQPEPNDIVGSRVLIAGQASGFEATVRARVRDGNGVELASAVFMSGGGGGEIGPFQVAIDLPSRPSTPQGFVEVFSDNVAYPDGPYDGPVAERDKVIVPVVFGSNIVESYVGFAYRIVVEGDTLAAIAADEYGEADEWETLYEANRDQIGNPNLIYSGQRLRVPRYVTTETATVDVYFLNTERYAQGTEPYEEAVQRTVPAGAPAGGVLQELFAGPTAAEEAAHLAVVRSGATGFAGLSIKSGIARVRLVGGCNSGGATYTIANLIMVNLKQFPTVDYVKIYDPAGETGEPDGPVDSIPACLEP